MAVEQMTLPYLQGVSEYRTSPYGYPEVLSAGAYDGVNIRNCLICRIDILSKLTDILTKEIMDKQRDVFYNFMSGNLSATGAVSQVIETYYVYDPHFHKFISELYYFNGDLQVKSLYQVVIETLRKKYLQNAQVLKDWCSQYSIKVLFESRGYLYVRYKDDASIVVPAGYKTEVVSRAKVWNGDMSERELSVRLDS